MDSLNEHRKKYAQIIKNESKLTSYNLVKAFATVPREKFLGAGPWKICKQPEFTYHTTPDDNPIHLYQNELIAIDEKRFLNNGHPSFLAKLIDNLDLKPGDHVLHIGCGVGYYTAIIAEVVGTTGSIIALEVDSELAAQAQKNLESYSNIKVFNEDGSVHDTGPQDVIFVNAGTTHPQSLWINNLNNTGRLLFPLTIDVPYEEGNKFLKSSGIGHILKVKHINNSYSAHFVTPTMIFHCISARSDKMNQRLNKAYSKGSHEQVKLLRRDPHDLSTSCWLHGEGFCLSM